MFIELRIATDSFRKRLRARAKSLVIERTTPLTLPDGTTPLPLAGCGGGEIWLDRIDFWEATILDTNTDGSLSVQQPIDMFVVRRSALEQNGAAPSPPCWQGTIVAVFRLGAEEVDGVPRLCMSFERFDPGTGVPSQITDFLNIALAEEAARLAGACEGVEIAVLDALFDGDPPGITSLTLALSSNTSRIGLRIDFDVHALGFGPTATAQLLAQQATQRANFANATFLADDTSLPWTLMIHSSLLTSGIKRQLQAGVEGNDKLDLFDGPTANFLIDTQHKPRIETSVEVQVIDACLCFSAETDLNVVITSKVYLTLPEPDVLETRMEVEFDLDDLEVFCCSLTASVLWPIVGDSILLKNDDFGEEYGGGLVAHVFAPFVLAIAIMALAHSTAEDMITAPDDDWEKLDEDDDKIVFRRRWNVDLGDVGFGAMSATSIRGENHIPSGAQGIVLSGSLASVTEAPDAKLVIEPDPEFVIGWNDPCGDATAVNYWVLGLGSVASIGSAPPIPLQVFDVRVVEGTDPLNQYTPYVNWKGLVVEIRVPFSKIKAGYKNHPYQPQLLIITSGGIRIIELPELMVLTTQEVDHLEFIKEMWQVANCNDWKLSDAFWGGSRYNPIWTVDPGPERVVHHYWEAVVEGLMPSDSVAIDDLGGHRLAVIESTVKGGLAGYVVQSPGMAGAQAGLSLVKAGAGADTPVIVAKSGKAPKPLRIARKDIESEALRLRKLAGGKPVAKRPVREKQRLILRQVALENQSTIHAQTAVRDIAFAPVAGRVQLALADAHGVSVYSMRRGAAALERRVSRPGVDRVLRWNDGWYSVGDGGLRPLTSLRAANDESRCRCDDGVFDADADGSLLLALDKDGVWSREAGRESTEPIADVRGTLIAVHNKTFAVAGPDAVQVFARARRGRAAPIGAAKLRDIVRIRAVRGPGDSYRVDLADGTAAVVTAADTSVSVTTRIPTASRIEIGARIADLVALVETGSHDVTICRIGRQETLRR